MLYRLMLVEDEPPAMRGIVRAIERCAASRDTVIVARASNGAQALELLPKAAPHILLSDIRMPVMDGFALIERVRAAYPDIRIAILSGHGDFAYVQRALRYNLADYLLKPIDPQELTALLLRMKQSVRRAVDERMAAFLNAVAYGLQPEAFPPQNHRAYLAVAAHVGPDAARTLRLGLPNPFTLSAGALLTAGRGALGQEDVWAAPTPVANRGVLLAGLEDDAGADPAALQAFAASLGETRAVTAVYQIVRSIGETREALAQALERLPEVLVPGATQILPLGQPLAPHAGIALTTRQKRALAAALQSGRPQAFGDTLGKVLAEGLPPDTRQRRVESLLDQMIAIIRRQAGVYAVMPAALDAAAAEALLHGQSPREIIARFCERLAPLLHSQEPDGTVRTTEAIVERIHRYIERHYDQSVELNDLTNRFGISYGYFCTLYKKQYGVSPLRHLVMLRIEKAKSMILSGADLPFRTIAQRVGYDDSHYFSRLFRSETGYSPTEYRERHPSGPSSSSE